MRQMLPAIPWRAAAPWGIALGGAFVLREALDIVKPTTDYGLRSLARYSVRDSPFASAPDSRPLGGTEVNAICMSGTAAA